MSEQKTSLSYELRTDFWRYKIVWRELGLGAELYESKNTVSVKHGNKVIWWWRPEKHHQQVKQESEKLAQLFARLTKKPEEFTPQEMSPERLVKAFVRHVLKLPINQQTKRYGDRFYYLVNSRPQLLDMDDLSQVQKSDELYGFNYELLGNSSHWHHLYLAPQPQGYAIELDIESAHFRALLKQPTLMLCDPGVKSGKPYFISDGGAMQKLRELNPQLPKWFRFRMLEIIGSHELRFYQINPATFSGEERCRPALNYGMAFNAVHKALYTVYETKALLANIVGDDLLRSHTDSFCIKAQMTRRAEEEMLAALKERGFEVSCKGIGWAHFWDIDTGILGLGKPKGYIDEINELRSRDGVYAKYCPLGMYKRWQHWLPPIPEWMLKEESGQIEFAPTKSAPKLSPEKLAGQWQIKIDGQWYRQKPE
ncbi:MAG: hypothetical protein RM338_03835 [Nostoc sp. DedQUE12a]|nr:hypothetical protein [Nostoc sp. DedQUE12a]